jgi:acetyl-CoA carboxylase biotin carboxyl carrier protein
MDIRKVKKLIELMEESSVGELEIREGEEYVRIARNAPGMVEAAQPTVITAPAAAAVVETSVESADTQVDDANLVRSPIVGTFYRASSPDSRPFVDVGSAVSDGQVVCIIEAMKILNQIESDHAGVVREVLVENGAPVEFGQPLMIIS